MADDIRDAKLVLRADDQATKTFAQVSKAIQDVTARLGDQSKAAKAGGGSLDGLTASLAEIQKLAKDLNDQKSAILAFERAGTSAEAAAAKVDKATKAYEAYKQKVGSTPTDAQSTTLGNKGASVERAQAGSDAATARLDAARAKVQALGNSTENTSAEIGKLNSEFAKLAPLFLEANAAVNSFSENQARAAAEAKAAVDAQTAAAREQAEAERTLEREAAVAASAQKQRTAALLAGSADILGGNKALEASFAELNAEIEGGRRASAFKQIGDDAVAASTNLNRFAQTTGAANGSLSGLASGIRAIVTPTLADVQTLTGAVEQVDKAAEIASSSQKRRVSEYQDALNAVAQANAGLVRQAGNIEAFSRQSAALERLEADLAQASIKVEQLGLRVREAGPDAERLAAELTKARAELERVGNATQAARKAFVEQSVAIKAAGHDVNDLAGSYARIEVAAKKGAGAAETLTAKVGGGGKGFLGLKPYELQNLSYQVNDVVTSLASGISPTQTLAQQGGQIAQIFPGALANLVKFLPIIAPVAAGLGLIIYNLVEVQKAAAAIRGFDAEFKLFGDAAGYSAEQFGKAQIELEHVGVSADDAKKTLREFIDSGLNPEGLDTFLETVRNIAAATGEDIPTAAQKYADALTHGYDAVASLNDITHTLTDAQLTEVKSLFDAGKAQEARTQVAEIYRQKSQGIADASRSDWAVAVQKLETAFRNFNEALHLGAIASGIFNIAVDAIVDKLKDLEFAAKLAGKALQVAVGLGKLANGDVSGGADIASAAGLLDTPDPKRPVSMPRRANGNPAAGQSGRRTAAGQSLLDDQQKQLRNAKELTQAQRLQQAQEEGARAAENAGLKDADVRQAGLNARKIEQGKIDKENAATAKSAAAAAAKAEREREAAARKAEERQNKINTLTRDLENTYDSLSVNKKVDPFAAIQAKADEAIRNIKAKFAELAKLGITSVDGRTEADFEAAVRASAMLEKDRVTAAQAEEKVNSLLEQRKNLLAEIEDRVKGGQVTPAQGLDEAQRTLAEINPRIVKAATDAQKIVKAFADAHPNEKLDAFLTKVGTVATEASGNNTLVTLGLGDLKQAQSELDALVARRDEVVKLQEALVKVGLQTTGGAEKAIQSAFSDSKPSILQAADAVQQIINRLLAVPGISAEVRAALEKAAGGLAVTRAQTKQLTADQVALRSAALGALSEGIGTFIESLGNTLANVIRGTTSLKGALAEIGQAALSFAASFTKAIAQAIIQLIALKIAKAALNSIGFLGGGFHAGGVIGRDAPTFKREVSPLAFMGAVRYHTGGLVGLMPDEVPAILQKGEEVITANDPRNRMNGGLAAGPAAAPTVNLKNVNLFDAGEAVSQGANTLVGEQAILNVISRNATKVKATIG